MLSDALKEIDSNTVSIYQDQRGIVVSFANGVVENLHIASMKPGAVRGNHVHDCDEVICIMGGGGICEIVVEDSPAGAKQRVQIDESIKTYRIKAGIKHTVQNIGENEFYLISFLTGRKPDPQITPVK